jgi:hypothetical protein
MKGLDVNGLMWTSATTKDLGTAGGWAIDETERNAKRIKPARMGTSGEMRIDD